MAADPEGPPITLRHDSLCLGQARARAELRVGRGPDRLYGAEGATDLGKDNGGSSTHGYRPPWQF